MREIRTSGSMSGRGKPSHGLASETLPEETGSQQIRPDLPPRRPGSTLPETQYGPAVFLFGPRMSYGDMTSGG